LYEHTPKKYYKDNMRYKWQSPKYRNSYKNGYGKGSRKKNRYMYKHDRRRYKKDYDYRQNRYKSSGYKYKKDKYKGKHKYQGNMICESKKGYKEKDYKYDDGYKNVHRYREPMGKYATDDYDSKKGDFNGEVYGDDHKGDFDDGNGFKEEGHIDLFLDNDKLPLAKEEEFIDEEEFFDEGFEEEFGELPDDNDDTFLLDEFEEDFGDDDFLDFDGDEAEFDNEFLADPDDDAVNGATAISLLMPLLYLLL